MKRNLVTWMMIMLLVVSTVLTACGNGEATTNSSSGTENAGSATDSAENGTGAVNASDLKPYEITWYYVGPNEQPDTKMVEEKINEYLKDKINATVKLRLFDWGTYNDKISAMIAAGESFDLCFTAAWMNDYVRNAQDGAFVELDQYFDNELKGTYEILGEDFLSGSVINGKNYGIPCNKEKARAYGFVYNKTLADKYGLDMSTVKTFADIEPMLQVIKENEPDVYPLHFENQGADLFLPFNFQNLAFNEGKATVITEEGKVVNMFEHPEVLEAFDLARDFYEKGYYRKDVLTAQDGPTVMEAGSWFAFSMNIKPGYAAEYQMRYPDADWVCDQVFVTPPQITNADTMGSMQAISRTSKDPQRVAMFLELVNTDPYLSNLINYGLEGVHYTKLSENVIEPVTDSQYGPNMQWMFGNQMLTYLYGNEDPEKWDKFRNYNSDATAAIDLGFIFDKEPVRNELAAVASVVREYYEGLVCGAIDPEIRIPEMNERLVAAGLDIIIEEEQKQFDAWLASK